MIYHRSFDDISTTKKFPDEKKRAKSNERRLRYFQNSAQFLKSFKETICFLVNKQYKI